MQFHHVPSCKTRQIRVAKAKGMDKLPEVMKNQNEEEKNGVRR